MKASEFVAYVDAFMSADKELVGRDGHEIWQPGRDYGSQRVKLPIRSGGELGGESLIVDAFPDRSPTEYHILIDISGAVCRVDFEPYATHPNPIDAIENGLQPVVTGPHFHSWEHNKGLFTGTNRPPKLNYAEPLAPNLRQFDSVLRWFCARHKIRIEWPRAIELPPRTRLL